MQLILRGKAIAIKSKWQKEGFITCTSFLGKNRISVLNFVEFPIFFYGSLYMYFIISLGLAGVKVPRGRFPHLTIHICYLIIMIFVLGN